MKLKTILITFMMMSSALLAAPQKKTETPKATESPAKEKGPEQTVQNFFELIQSRGTDSAIDYLFSSNPYVYERKDYVRSVKENITKLEQDLGKRYGQVLIQDRQFSDTLRIISYLVKYEKMPVRFTFIFYKADSRWVTYQFNVNDALNEATLQEAQSLRFQPVVK